MTVLVDDNTVKINTKLDELERHAKGCSQAVIDDTFVLGRYMDKFRPEDLDRLYKATGQFYNGCVCDKKGK